jgi:coenzyme Q-binding protein COQ10
VPRHHEERHLPYEAKQIYDLVADVARYPEFLPWTAAARIRSRTPCEGGEVMEADLVISFKVFRERFGSRVTLLPDFQTGGQGKILTEYLDGPFKHLKSVWVIQPAPQGGCAVVFDVDFEFRNAILAGVIGLVFDQAMRRVVRAFEERAQALYGRR